MSWLWSVRGTGGSPTWRSKKLGARPRFLAQSDPKTIGVDCRNRANRQFALMAFDDIVDVFRLAASWNSDQAQDAGMRMLEYDRQLAKVLVLRDQDALLSVGDA